MFDNIDNIALLFINQKDFFLAMCSISIKINHNAIISVIFEANQVFSIFLSLYFILSV